MIKPGTTTVIVNDKKMKIISINTAGDYASAGQCPFCGNRLDYYESVQEELFGKRKRKNS